MPAFLRISPMHIALVTLAILVALGVFMVQHFLVQFLVVALLVVVAAAALVAWLLWRQLEAAKTAKAGKEIEKAIDKQVEEEIQRSTFGQQAEVRNVKADWDQALLEFKRSAVGRRLGDKALAQHPMLLVIGPAGAGKTTLIEESELQSVLQDSTRRPRSVRGVGGARSFSWYFTEQAILLDMAGKTLRQSQFDDSDDWVAFLRSLRKLRPERPINGVVFTVPITAIAGAGKDKLEALAQTLRDRAQDLSHHLEMKFPCYLVLTQADHVAGFAETFAAFDGADAAQPWGLTYDATAAQTTPAEELFDREYSTLVAALGDLRRVRLARLTDEAQRMRALAFPGQVEALRADLRAFVKVLFARGKDGGGAWMRGLYFTCARVGLDTRDAVVAPVAEALGLATHLEAPSPEIARHAWFAQELWKRVIFRDTALAASNDFAMSRGARRQLMLLWGSVGAFVLGAFGFGLMGWIASTPVRALPAEAGSLQTPAEDVRIGDALRRLNDLRVTVAELQHRRAHGSLAQALGGYAGNRVVTAAEDLYQRQVLRLLVKPRMAAIHDQLKADVAAGTGPFADLFYQYQAYRQLADPEYRPTAEDSLTLGKVLTRTYRPDFARNTGEDPAKLAELLRGQMQMLAQVAGQRELMRLGETYDADLARAALLELRRRWGEVGGLYADLVADANRGTPALTLDTLLIEAKRKGRILVASERVPGAFTRAGWEHDVQPRLDVLRNVVGRDKLMQEVLGTTLLDLESRFRQAYAHDYALAWVRFLRSVSSRRDPNDDDNLRGTLKRESWHGEIDAVIRRAAAETHMPESTHAPAEIAQRFGALELWLKRPASSFMERITDHIPGHDDEHRSPHERFLWYLAKAAKDKKGVHGDDYRSAWNKTAYAPLDSVGSDVQAATRRVLHAVYSLVGGSGVENLGDAGAGGAGGPGGAGGGPGGGPGGASLDVAAFTNDWQTLVVGAWQRQVGNNYPFQPGGDDLTFADFSGYFGPGGNLDQVYDKYMAPYIDKKTGAQLATPPGAITGAQVAWFRKALAIQQACFGGGGKDPDVKFDVRTTTSMLAPAQRLHSVAWQVGAGNFSYDMGPSEPMTLEWNADTAPQGSKITADLDHSIVEGPSFLSRWGFFRVLDAARLVPGPNHRVLAKWTFKGVSMQVEIDPTTTVHPFVEGFFRIGPPPAAAQM